MDNLKVNNLTTFLPAKDFKLCCKFYEDLGFEKTVDIGDSHRYEKDGFGFWLKDYYVKEYADNTMLCLYVADVTSWFEHLKNLDLHNNYNGLAKIFSEPHDEEHGSVIMQFGDPTGVLWHVYQGT